MSNILSQEEIDALLGGLDSGNVSPTQAGGASQSSDINAVSYNFVNQDRIVRGGMPTLEVVHDRMARLLRTSITQVVRRTVDIQVGAHTEFNYGEFSRGLSLPSSLHVLKMEPLRGYGLLVLSGNLIYTMMDIVFGGNGIDACKEESREFTLIEQRMISSITEMFERNYTEAWKPAFPVNVEAKGSETNPQFINIAQNSDAVIGIDFEIFMDDIQCGLSICLPHSTIAPIKDTLRGSIIGETMDHEFSWADPLRESLVESNVEIRAMLGSADISVHDLLKLKRGDIIQLREDYEHPIDIRIEGVPKFWGSVGSHMSSRAIQITGIREGRIATNG